MESFIGGINAFINSNCYSSPVEFTLANLNVQPWTVEDVTAIARVLSFEMCYGWTHNVVNMCIREIFAKDSNGNDNGNSSLFNVQDFENFLDINMGPLTCPKGGIEVNEIDWEALAKLQANMPPTGQGSNSWVVSGKYSANGKPILASDPHLGASLPNMWYQIHLKCDEFNYAGVGVAGSPFLQIGHSDYVAQGITLSYADICDVFVEEFDAANDTRYKTVGGEWLNCEEYLETIKIKGKKDPHVERIRVTRHGPVISGIMKHFVRKICVAFCGCFLLWLFYLTCSFFKKKPTLNFTSTDSETKVVKEIALQATYLNTGKHSLMDALYHCNKAKNYTEWKQGIDRMENISLNITFADVHGNIGYAMTGLIPLRTEKSIAESQQVHPGATGEYDWQGFIPIHENPCALNPEQGYIISCNHRIVDYPSQYKHFIGRSFRNGVRAARVKQMIDELIAKKKFLTREDHCLMQLDVFDIGHTFTKKLLNQHFNFSSGSGGNSSADSLVSKKPASDGGSALKAFSQCENPSQITFKHVVHVMEAMKSWDGNCSTTSIGCTVTVMFETLLLRRLLKASLRSDEVLEMIMGFGLNDHTASDSDYSSHTQSLLGNFFARAGTPNSVVEKAGGPLIVICQSLIDVIVKVRSIMGSNLTLKYPNVMEEVEVQQYEWGKIHTLSFPHTFEEITTGFSRGPYAVAGNSRTVNLHEHKNTGESFETKEYPSFRMVCPMGNVAESVAILAPGNSGVIDSAHYDDWTQLFLEGKMLTMLWHDDDVKLEAEATLQFNAPKK